MRKYLLLLIILSFSDSIYAQQEKIDSLISILSNPDKDETADLNYEIAELYAEIDAEKAMEYTRKGISIAEKHKDLYSIAEGKMFLGGHQLNFEQQLEAEMNFRAADSIISELIKVDSSHENLRLWVVANFNIGVALSYQGLSEDIFYLEKITPLAEKTESYDILARANTNLGINFYNNEQFDKAYKYFLVSGDQHIKNNDYVIYTFDRLAFASCLLNMDSLERAKTILDTVETIVDTLGKKENYQLYYNILGEYYYEKEEYDTAIENYKKAEELLKSNEVVKNDLLLYMNFMESYAAMGNYKAAHTYAYNGLQIAKTNQNKLLEADLNKALSDYEYNLGHHELAYTHLQNYVAISDSANLAEQKKELNRVETKFQTERKERKILELQNENNQVELLLSRNRAQNYFLLLVSLGLLLLAVTAFVGYRNFKKKNQLKAIEIEKLKYEQEAKVYNAMLDGQEHERKRLAIDLHDGLAGRLSATRINLEKLTLGKKQGEGEEELQILKAAENIDDALSELRSIARNLMPETLFKFGLKTAIEDYCSSISSGTEDVKFILQFYDSDIPLSKNALLTLYRIMQELINNAVKHAKAKEVLIQYIIENQKINITVEDNGIGFSKSDLINKSGMGLKNLNTRVAYLNGTIEFDSIPGEGTTVQIEIDMTT